MENLQEKVGAINLISHAREHGQRVEVETIPNLPNASFNATNEIGGIRAGFGVADPADSPSLSNNNNSSGGGKEEGIKLKGGALKSREKMKFACKILCSEVGLCRIAFFTVTFPDNVLDVREASRRMRSFQDHVLIPRYGKGVKVLERQFRGRIHFHILLAVPNDIRTGWDFELQHKIQALYKSSGFNSRNHIKKNNPELFREIVILEKRLYATANEFLRAEWAFIRSITNYDGKHTQAPYAGIGRIEMTPVFNEEAVTHYIADYIKKGMITRWEDDKGARLWSSFGLKVPMTLKFSWNSPGAWCFRKKLALFLGARVPKGKDPFEYCRAVWGRFWMWRIKDSVLAQEIPFEAFPTVQHYNAYINGGGHLSVAPIMGVDRPLEWFSGLKIKV